MKKTFKLPKEFTEKWITALEEGNYNQGTDVLFTTEEYSFNDDPVFDNKSSCSYCCLGVGMHIAGYDDINDLYARDLPDNVSLNSNNDFPMALVKEPLTRKMKEGDSLISSSLITILTGLNDGMNLNRYNIHMSLFPDLVFDKIPGVGHGTSGVSYTFSEIAKWIKDNVELV